MSNKICRIEGCNNLLNSHTAKGLCKTHYRRFLLYGDPLASDRRKMRAKNICSVDGCGNLCHGQGYCEKHYRKYVKYGDATFVHRKFREDHHREHRSWEQMIARCANKNNANYHNYGGRGIKVCDRWSCGIDGFYNFLEDMGKRHNGMTLDRIDYNGGYCKENCRWVNMVVQNNNKRNNHYITLYGKTKTVTQWAREYNINPATVFSRIKMGWSSDKLFSPPRR